MTHHWVPAVVLSVGALFTVGIDTQQSLPLRSPLGEALPSVFGGDEAVDVRMSPAEQAATGVTDYVIREYRAVPDSAATSNVIVYVAFYDRQLRGRTIHSPKNCLPGTGWEALAATTLPVRVGEREVTINRYLLQKDAQQALVLYWYQGRGRVQANEYLVKWDLLRDSALRQRSDEALVRIVVPITDDEESALDQARRYAQDVIPRIDRVLPE